MKILEKQDVRVVLLDLLSAGVDGAAFFHDLHGSREPWEVEVIAIAPSPRLERLEAMFESGVTDFVVDPTDPGELGLRIRAALTRLKGCGEVQRLRREIERLEGVCNELRRLSDQDALTSLANRRGLFQKLELEVDRSERQGLPLSGIMLDVDNFKWINDTFGHTCGDEVLYEVGQRLVRNLRTYDFAARYGGEEFFIILPNTRSGTALRIADRFRNDLEKAAFVCNGAQIRLTISLGVAELRPGETLASWVARADSAMYQAKQDGRNRAMLSTSG